MKRTPLRRRARLAPVNRARRAKRFAATFGGPERVAWINSLPCLCEGRHPNCSGPTVTAHVRSRGAGGTWRDVVPLSSGCHAAQHAAGWGRWHELAGLDLGSARDRADELATRGPGAPVAHVEPSG
jgi:hypothetical protein